MISFAKFRINVLIDFHQPPIAACFWFAIKNTEYNFHPQSILHQTNSRPSHSNSMCHVEDSHDLYGWAENVVVAQQHSSSRENYFMTIYDNSRRYMAIWETKNTLSHLGITVDRLEKRKASLIQALYH